MSIHFNYRDEKYIIEVSLKGSRLGGLKIVSHKISCSQILNDLLSEYVEVTDIKEEILDRIQDVLDGNLLDEVAGVDFTSVYITPDIAIFYTFGNLDEKNLLATYTDENSIETRLLAALLQALLKELENNELTEKLSE